MNPQQPHGRRSARLWKVTEIAAGCLALAIWVGAMALWMHLDATRPHTADAATGRIYALNTHGSIAYLNHRERTMMRTLTWTAGALFVTGVGIDILVRPFRRGSAQ
jgi:membrane protein YdbS with pleckstrin-like domain